VNHSPPDVIPTYTRAGFLVSGVASLFAWVGYRLLTLGSGRASNWFARSLAATGLTARRIPHRGEIQDRNGYVLAVSEPVVVVCANPSLIADRAPQLAAVLESCLQIPKEKLIARLQLRPLRNAKGQVILDHRGRPVPVQREQLKSNVTLFEWRRIRESLKDASFGLDPADKKQRELLKLLRGKAIFAEPAQAR
jgi:cell division protein FtsI/penicillin-binding protein 2